MKTKKIYLLGLVFGLTISLTHAQWGGSTSSLDGDLYRNGSIGIGTNAPSYKIHIVNGDVKLNAIYENETHGNGDRLFRIDNANGRVFGINAYRSSTAYNKLITRIGINYSIDGNNSNTQFAINGSKKSPVIELNAEDGSISLFGENGSGGNWRTVAGTLKLGLYVRNDGNVGIGTSDPGTQLQVLGNTRLFGDVAIGDGTDSDLKVTFTPKAEGISPVTFYHGRWNGAFKFVAPIGEGTEIEYMRITGDWQKAIVTVYGDQRVQNKLEAQEIEVKESVISANIKTQDINAKNLNLKIDDVADYVFEENYNLRSLEEVESYIKSEKHLPEIPSAKELESNGMNVAVMNNLLLKKVEELTLYIIELKKKNDELVNRIELIEKQ